MRLEIAALKATTVGQTNNEKMGSTQKRHIEKVRTKDWYFDKPLPMCVWNHCRTALFEFTGIRCMSLTFEVEGLKFCSDLLFTTPYWAFSPGVCTVFWGIKEKNQKHAECFTKWDISHCEVNRIGCCWSSHTTQLLPPFPPFLLSFHPVLPSLGCPLQPPHLILCYLLSDCSSLSFCLSPSQSFIPPFLPIIPSSLLLLPQTLYFYQLRDSVLLISIIQRCRTEPVTRVTASCFTARTLT